MASKPNSPATEAAPASHMSFDGTLTRAAEMRQVLCDKPGPHQGQLRAAVCLHLLTSTKRAVHTQYFFNDALAAQAYAKALKKGALLTVHIPIEALHLSGVADFVEVHAPALPAQVTPLVAQRAVQEPELNF